MRGTRQGDFSRGPSADPDDRELLMQQGRVLLDADWNAQTALLRDRLEAGAVDTLGANGGPVGAAGFGIDVEPLAALGGRAYAVVGEGGGFVLPTAGAAERGLTLEVRLASTGDGTIAELNPVGECAEWSLRIVEGAIRFHRPGAGGGTIESEPIPADDLERIQHLTLVSGPGRTAIYVDGKPLASASFGMPPASGSLALWIGASCEEGRSRDLLRAWIGGVRLWHASLDDTKVAELAGRRRIADREPPLAGDWRFDDGRGREVVDHSLQCNHAELRGPGLAWEPHAPQIGAGRYYVQGVLCEQPRTIGFGRQTDLPNATFPRPGAEPSSHLFYLDVWERTVSAVEDPRLREVALGGVDTTVRSRQVAQVRTLEVPPGEAPLGTESATWKAFLAASRQRGKLFAKWAGAGGRELRNCLYRVEIHDSGFPYVWPRPPGAAAQAVAIEALSSKGVESEEPTYRVVRGAGRLRVGQVVEAFNLTLDERGEVGPLLVVRAIDDKADEKAETIRLAAVAGAALPEDSRFRIRPVATFKWSRWNASVSFGIAGIDGSRREVSLAPSARSLQEVKVGHWLEVSTKEAALTGDRSPLVKVTDIDVLSRKVVLDQPLPASAGGRDGEGVAEGAILRLWDQGGTGVTVLPTGVLAVTVSEVGQPLELGIEVVFIEPDRLTAGDYWWLVSRGNVADTLWPKDRFGEPERRGPDGVEHRYAPLAMLSYDAAGLRLDDLRSRFNPLVQLAGGDGGGRVDGSLTVPDNLTVGGHATVDGRVQAEELLGTVCSIDAVGRRALAKGAVTLRALAPEIGIVPSGCSLLGRAPQAPDGYVATGASLTLACDPVRWRDRAEIGDGPPGPMVSVAFGGIVFSFLESGEVWSVDAESLAWRQRRPQPLARHGFAAAGLDDRIYLIGGADAAGRPVDDVQAYEPSTDLWHDCRPLPGGRTRAAAVAAEGWLHVMGGDRSAFLGPRATRRHDAYDPMTDAWHRRRPLPGARMGAAAAWWGGGISLVGGEQRWLFGRLGRVLVDTHLRYLPAGDRWLPAASALGEPRTDVRLVRAFDQLWSVGGRSASGWTPSCARYEPAQGAWVESTSLHEAIDRPGVTAVGGALVVIGAMRAGGRGTLVESADVARRFYVHERERRAQDTETGEVALPADALDGSAEEPDGSSPGGLKPF